MVTVGDGGWDVGRAICDLVVVPHEASVFGTDSDDTTPGHLDVLFHATSVGNDNRAVTRAVFSFLSDFAELGLPLGGTGLFIERNHEGIVGARGADDMVTIDERRFGKAPTRHHFSVPFLFEILGPETFSLS